MSSSLHVDNRKQDILILGEGPAQELDETTLTAEKKYTINFVINRRNLNLHYNRVDSYIFVNRFEIYKFKI